MTRPKQTGPRRRTNHPRRRTRRRASNPAKPRPKLQFAAPARNWERNKHSGGFLTTDGAPQSSIDAGGTATADAPAPAANSGSTGHQSTAETTPDQTPTHGEAYEPEFVGATAEYTELDRRRQRSHPCGAWRRSGGGERLGIKMGEGKGARARPHLYPTRGGDRFNHPRASRRSGCVPTPRSSRSRCISDEAADKPVRVIAKRMRARRETVRLHVGPTGQWHHIVGARAGRFPAG
jgi:hypothetical protein